MKKKKIRYSLNYNCGPLWTTSASLSKMQNIIFLRFWKTQHHRTNPSNVQIGILSTSVKLTLTKYWARKGKETLTKYQQSGVLLQATGQLSTKQHCCHFILSLLKKTQSWEISFWLMFWKKKKKKTLIHVPRDAATITVLFISTPPLINFQDTKSMVWRINADVQSSLRTEPHIWFLAWSC